MPLFGRRRKEPLIEHPSLDGPMRSGEGRVEGIGDFFNLFLPNLMHGKGPPVLSRHKQYLAALSRDDRFMAASGMTTTIEIVGMLKKSMKIFAIQLAGAERKFGVGLRHLYRQAFDIRKNIHESCLNGWCLGLCGYWLRRKKIGQNIFPDTLYTDGELSLERGAAIKLMVNQSKLKGENTALATTGPIPPKYVMTLRYIGNGEYNPQSTVFSGKTSKAALGNVTAAVLRDARRPNPQVADGSLHYLITYLYQSRGVRDAHAVALDMGEGEFFDPNRGVWTHASGAKGLVTFLFEHYLPNYHEGICSIRVYRCA